MKNDAGRAAGGKAGMAEAVVRTQHDLVGLGDYVLATKYSDGDPQDHWAIGFFSGITAPHYNPMRYDVVDSSGNQFRGNGFRRIKKISKKRGEWMLRHKEEIARSGLSVWHFARCRMDEPNPAVRGDRLAGVPCTGVVGGPN